MDDAEELAMVRAALASPLSTCVLWASGVKERIAADPDLQGMTTRAVREELRGHARSGRPIEQKVETWGEYSRRFRFCYVVLLDLDFLPRPLFVEIRSGGGGPEDPVALVVSVHLSFKERA